MTEHGSFKKVVRRHGQETGQRYTEALTDLEAWRRVCSTRPSINWKSAGRGPRPLYLVCFDYRRCLANGQQPNGSEGWWNLIEPEHITTTVAATRTAAVRR